MSRANSEAGSPVKPFRSLSGEQVEPLDLDEDRSSSETIPLVDSDSPALGPTTTPPKSIASPEVLAKDAGAL